MTLRNCENKVLMDLMSVGGQWSRSCISGNILRRYNSSNCRRVKSSHPYSRCVPI